MGHYLFDLLLVRVDSYVLFFLFAFTLIIAFCQNTQTDYNTILILIIIYFLSTFHYYSTTNNICLNDYLMVLDLNIRVIFKSDNSYTYLTMYSV